MKKFTFVSLISTLIIVCSCTNDISNEGLNYTSDLNQYRQMRSLYENSFRNSLSSYISSLIGITSRGEETFNILDLMSKVEVMSPKEYLVWSSTINENYERIEKKKEENIQRVLTIINTDELSNYYDFSNSYFKALGVPELEDELFLSIADKPEPLQKTYSILVGLIDATLKDDVGEPLIIHFSEYTECEAKLFLDIVCELADDAIEMSLDVENPFMDIHVSCDAANQISGAIRDYYLCHHKR